MTLFVTGILIMGAAAFVALGELLILDKMEEVE